MQLACVVVDEVAEQAERDALGAVLAGSSERVTVAPRRAYSSGISHACASAASETGSASGDSSTITTAIATNGTTCASVVSVHSRSRRCSRSAVMRGRQ